MTVRKIAAAGAVVSPETTADSAKPNRRDRRATASNRRAEAAVTPPPTAAPNRAARRAAASITPAESARRERQRSHSIAEAAKELGICRASVYKLIGEGRLKPVPVGARQLIPDVQIAALLGE
jgi:hypothetical protein